MFRKKFRIERTEKRMAFNPIKLMELKNLRDRFAQNHPKFVKFMSDLASSQIEEGTILEVTVKKPDGRTMVSNIKVTASDLEMLQANRCNIFFVAKSRFRRAAGFWTHGIPRDTASPSFPSFSGSGGSRPRGTDAPAHQAFRAKSRILTITPMHS